MVLSLQGAAPAGYKARRAGHTRERTGNPAPAIPDWIRSGSSFLIFAGVPAPVFGARSKVSS